jgi:Domain of unknown function (DUF4129)
MNHSRIHCTFRIAAFAGTLVAAQFTDAVAAPRQSNSIRDRMRNILDAPEFRNLVPLKPRGRPGSFSRGGDRVPGGGEGNQEFRRDENGNPVILRDGKGRARIGKDNDGRAVIGRDGNGRDVVLQEWDKNGRKRDFVVRDGKPENEEALRDQVGRNVLVRDGNDKVPIGRDGQGRAVIGKDRFDRDVILRDAEGKEVVVRDGQGRQGMERDQFGRRIIFRDQNRRAKIGRDQQGRAILGKDENGRDIVLRDGNRRDVAARNDDARNGVLRDQKGRPVIFRDENGRARFKRNQDMRGNIGHDARGRDVQVRDQKGRDVFVFDEDEFRKLARNDRANGPFGDGNRRFGRNGPNGGGNNGRFNPGDGGGRNRDFDPAPKDSRSSSSSGPTITASGPGAVIGGILQVVGWIITAIVAAAMLFMIGKGIVALVAWFRERDKDITDATDAAIANNPLEPDKSPGELPADVYIQRARELAASGKYREAIAQLLLGGMSNLERAGVVKYRKGLTHRDYVRASRSQPREYQSMRAMVRLYEPLGFGRRTPTPKHFERSLSAYEAGFRRNDQ